jgi:hypothetical protein
LGAVDASAVLAGAPAGQPLFAPTGVPAEQTEPAAGPPALAAPLAETAAAAGAVLRSQLLRSQPVLDRLFAEFQDVLGADVLLADPARAR